MSFWTLGATIISCNRSEGLSLQTSVTGARLSHGRGLPLFLCLSASVLTRRLRRRTLLVKFWILPFRSRLSLRVPGDTGMRPWTKDV